MCQTMADIEKENSSQGVVYSCPNFETFKKILEERAFVWPRERFHIARLVKADMPVFVLLMDTHQLWGIYRATENPELIRTGKESDHFARVRLLPSCTKFQGFFTPYLVHLWLWACSPMLLF